MGRSRNVDAKVSVVKKLGRPPKSGVDIARRIQDAAFELFSLRSFSAVSNKEISQAADVNSSLISYYFGSKQELYDRVVEDAAEEAYQSFANLLLPGQDPVSVLRAWIGHHIQQAPSMERLLRIVMRNDASTSDRATNAIRRFYDHEFDVLGAALRSGIDAGTFHKVDVPETIEFISTFLDGSLLRRAIVQRPFDQAKALAMLEKIVISNLAATT